MRTNVLIPIVVVVVLALGITFAMNRSDNTTATSETVETPTSTTDASVTAPEVDSTVVTYTANGFSPAVVTIKQGQTVTFTNNSTNPMWVASDPHPTHTKYGEFDSERNVSEGGSYSFTFTKSGSWSYHNHTQSSHKGTVVVE